MLVIKYKKTVDVHYFNPCWKSIRSDNGICIAGPDLCLSKLKSYISISQVALAGTD